MINKLEYQHPLEIDTLDCLAPVDHDEREAEEREIESLPEYYQLNNKE